MTTALAPGSESTFHTVQRRLAELLPDAETLAGGASLELTSILHQDRPRLDPPELLEGRKLAAIRVEGEPVARFAAFLDGTQTSRLTQYIGGIPIVHGASAAVVRTRRDRRMTTWKSPLVRRRLYAPLDMLSPKARRAVEESGADVCDTSAKRELDSIHPLVLQEAALQAVQRDREELERSLAEAWCDEGSGELFVDGGISASEKVAGATTVIGVVKSHRQLHVHGDDLGVILGLRSAERSSVVRVAPRARSPVGSWYLRLRGASGRDPLWGLVRVEVAEPESAKSAGKRADEVSRWVLAEALPLAVPDGRWDKMVYGIRDCEEFLRAIQ